MKPCTRQAAGGVAPQRSLAIDANANTADPTTNTKEEGVAPPPSNRTKDLALGQKIRQKEVLVAEYSHGVRLGIKSVMSSIESCMTFARGEKMYPPYRWKESPLQRVDKMEDK